jgi:uncharacterized membrane-anchored protein YitT (DUF2179 family)
MCPKILAGAIIDAAGISFLLYPNGIISGGIMGIAMILNKLLSTPIGLLTIVFNIPLFLVAWKTLGPKFLIGSLLGMALSSVILDLLNLFPPVYLTNNILMAGLFGGALSGLGQGIIYSSGGSTGGIDIIAKVLRLKFSYINLGNIVMILNAAVFTMYAIALGKYEAAMYSAVTAFVSSRVIDMVLYGLNYSKICFIISEKSEKISEIITKDLQRGVTMLYGRGAYSGNDKMVLLCAIKKQQILELRKIVKLQDPEAFVIISDSRDVLGNGFNILEEKD